MHSQNYLEETPKETQKHYALQSLENLILSTDTVFNKASNTANLSRTCVAEYANHIGGPTEKIIKNPYFKHLTGISQMVAKFTTTQRHQNNSRHVHCLQAAAFGKFFAEHSVRREAFKELDQQGLNPVNHAIAICLLHDICHPPFNHTGEEIISRVYGVKDFDHDIEAYNKITGTSLRKTLTSQQIDPEIVARVISEDQEWFKDKGLSAMYNVLFELKEAADRLSYLVNDLSCDIKKKATFWSFGQLGSPIANLQITRSGVKMTDQDAFTICDTRFNHFSENTYEPTVLLTKEVLIEEVRKLHTSGRLNLEGFLDSNEEEILLLFPENVRDILSEGVDKSFLESRTIELSKLLPNLTVRTEEGIDVNKTREELILSLIHI